MSVGAFELLEELQRGSIEPDEAHGRVYGWLLGTVTDVDTNLMQVKARLEKQGDNESTDWLVPIGMGSMESLPENGDKVGVIFRDGDVHRGAYFCFPQSTTKNRPGQHIVLGDVFMALYNDLVAKFNTLQSNYQAFYTFVQGHKHLTFNTVSGDLAEVTIGPTAHNTGTNGGKGQTADGSTVAASASDAKALSKRSLVR